MYSFFDFGTVFNEQEQGQGSTDEVCNVCTLVILGVSGIR